MSETLYMCVQHTTELCPISTPSVSKKSLPLQSETSAYHGSVWVQYEVTKRPVTVTWATDEDGNIFFDYDGQEHAPTATLGSNDVVVINGKSDDVSLVITGGTTEAGTHIATATLAGTDAKNYVISEGATKEFTINPETVTINWGNASLTYNGQEQAPTAELSTPIEGITVNVSGAEKNASAEGASYTATASLSGKGAGNYSISESTKTKEFTISPASLDVKVKDASKTYGENDPTFTGTVTGLMEGDQDPFTYSRTNADVNDAEEYAGVLTATIAAGGNYKAGTVTNGKFTINRYLERYRSYL